jgi:alpha-1,2-mannosyltransferase
LLLNRGICREFGVHVGRSWLVLQLFAAGMFVSSTALLPSTFSMYFTMASLSAWWHQKYKLAIFFTAISVLMGWPFVGLISLPIIIDIIFRQKYLRLFIFWSIISGVTVLLPMILIDSSYFGKLVLAPVNIVMYNVFKKDGGPELYGTEPFAFYIYNGFLNYNFIWLLALITPIMLIICWLAVPAKRAPTLTLPYYLSLSPFYLWIAVMMCQPHKEERFLFPIYPLISLCGAIAIDVIQKLFFRVKIAIFSLNSVTHYLNHSTFIVVFFVVISTMFNVSRILALYKNYHASMDTFMELSNSRDLWEDPYSKEIMNVCIGKDWHRYPSSFFLPSTKYSIRFIRSEFDGMLPAYYSNQDNATQIPHKYFNDMNKGNDYMIFKNIEKCHFLIDIDLKMKTNSKLEPNYSADKETWTILKELPFLNSHLSHPLYRAFYIPLISQHHLKYGSFNLLQKQTQAKVTSEKQ